MGINESVYNSKKNTLSKTLSQKRTTAKIIIMTLFSFFVADFYWPVVIFHHILAPATLFDRVKSKEEIIIICHEWDPAAQ